MVEKIRLPLQIEPCEESFGILDAAGWPVAFVYFSDTDEENRFAIKRLSREQADAFTRWVVRTANAMRDHREKGADLAQTKRASY